MKTGHFIDWYRQDVGWCGITRQGSWVEWDWRESECNKTAVKPGFSYLVTSDLGVKSHAYLGSSSAELVPFELDCNFETNSILRIRRLISEQRLRICHIRWLQIDFKRTRSGLV